MQQQEPRLYKQAIRSFMLVMLVTMLAITVAKAEETLPEPFSEPSATQDVPLDGGVSLLLVGTAAYGIKKLRKKC
jgi:hypothetical protein